MTNIEIHNDIAVLTIDNPPDNRLEKPEFIDKKQLEAFLKINKAKSLIINGTGRHFSAGADLESIHTFVKSQCLQSELSKGKGLLSFLYDLNIPVISAIEGVCFGGGLEIALNTHIRVVSKKALLAFPETMHKLMPGLSGSYRIKEFLSLGKSMEAIFCNRIINAEEAENEGFADYIVEPKQSFSFAMNLAERMTRTNDIHIINNVMKALKNAYTMSRDHALEEESKLFCELAKKLDNDEA